MCGAAGMQSDDPRPPLPRPTRPRPTGFNQRLPAWFPLNDRGGMRVGPPRGRPTATPTLPTDEMAFAADPIQRPTSYAVSYQG